MKFSEIIPQRREMPQRVDPSTGNIMTVSESDAAQMDRVYGSDATQWNVSDAEGAVTRQQLIDAQAQAIANNNAAKINAGNAEKRRQIEAGEVKQQYDASGGAAYIDPTTGERINNNAFMMDKTEQQLLEEAGFKGPDPLGGIDRPEMESGIMKTNTGDWALQAGLGATYGYKPNTLTSDFELGSADYDYDPNAVESTYDRQYMDRIFQDATAETPTWLTNAYAQQDLMRDQNLEKSMKSSSAALAKARADMAMRGGAKSGSMNMLSRMGNRDLNANLAGIRSQDAVTRAGMRTDASKMQQNMLGMLPGMEAQRAGLDAQLGMFNEGQLSSAAANRLQADQFNINAGLQNEAQIQAMNQFNEQQLYNKAQGDAQVQQYNIGNVLSSIDAQNKDQLAQYGEQMQAWAASQQAEATQNAGGGGGGGCFITTAVCEFLGLDDDNEILTAFRKFRDEYMSNDPEMKRMVMEYYEKAPFILGSIELSSKKSGDYGKVMLEILSKYLVPAFKEIKFHRNYRKALEIYTEMVEDLTKQYSN